MTNLHYSPDTTFTLQSLPRPQQDWQPSLFMTHLLQPGSFSLTPREHYPQDWITISLLSCIVIIAWVRVFYYKRLKQIYKAPFSQRFLNILSREGNLFKERIAIALTLVYLVTLGFIIYKLFRIYSPVSLPHYKEYEIFAICILSLFLFWLAKIFMIRLLGIVFKTGASANVYLQNTLVFCFITGLISLPLLILMIFLNSFILFYITLCIIGLLYMFRVMRGFFIGISLKKFSWLFLFVYLCTLEILPLVIILKGFYLFSPGL
jgi:hypothetical protein